MAYKAHALGIGRQFVPVGAVSDVMDCQLRVQIPQVVDQLLRDGERFCEAGFGPDLPLAGGRAVGAGADHPASVPQFPDLRPSAGRRIAVVQVVQRRQTGRFGLPLLYAGGYEGQFAARNQRPVAEPPDAGHGRQVLVVRLGPAQVVGMRLSSLGFSVVVRRAGDYEVDALGRHGL